MRLFSELRNYEQDPRQNKLWRIILFSLVEVSAKATIHIMGFWMYFTQNVLGLGVFLGLVITPMFLIDAITDPLMASFFDRFESKYGKFKPIIAVGGIVTVVPGLVIFFFPAQTTMPNWLAFTILTAMYVLIVIGTTILRTTARAGQSIITQDPRQRPVYAIGKTVFEGVMMTTISLIITSNIFGEMQEPKVWHYSIVITSMLITFSIIVSMLSVSNRDNPTYYNLGNEKQKISIFEFFSIIKTSGPLKRILVATVSDTFASSIRGGLSIYLFANIIMNRSLFSFFDIVSSILLGLPILFIGIRYATKTGSAKAYLNVSYIQTTLCILGLFATILLLPADPNYVYPGLNINSVIVLTILGSYISTFGISSSLISSLSGDLADYEYVENGKFIPAVIGAVITTMGKVAESFKGFVLVSIMIYCGFKGMGDSAVVPENVFINHEFYYSIVIAVFGLPAIGHFLTIVAMRKYPLDDATMQRVSQVLLEDRGLANNEVTSNEAN